MAMVFERGTDFKSKSNLRSLESIWQPFLILLKSVGLYHYKENCTWRENIWKLHSCFMILFVFGMFILFMVHSFSEIVGKDGQQANQFVCIADAIWFLVMLGFSVGLFLTSHQPSKLGAFYGKFLELHQLSGIRQAQEAIRKQTRFLVVFLVVLTPLFWSEMVYYRIDEGWPVYVIFSHLVLECIEIFSLAFFILVFTTLSTLISFSNAQFLKFVKNPGRTPYTSWETCRSTFVLVVELVEIADSFLCFPVGWCILCYLMQVTFFSFTYVLYSQRGESELLSIFNSALWNIVLIVSLFVIMWKASAVHNDIHSTFPDLNKLKLGNFPLSMQSELIFIQNRLGNSTIGISAFKVHLITRPFASSIVSVYLTYVIILLQFRNSKEN